MRHFAGAEFMKFFIPMLKLVTFDFESRILSALDFAERASVSMAVFDISSSEEGDLVMKAFMDMDYEEFQFLISKQEPPKMTEATSTLRMDVHESVLASSVIDDKIADLESKLKELKEMIRQRQEDLYNLEKQIGDPNVNQDDLNTKIENFRRKIAELQAEARKIEEELAKLKSERTAQ
jgi:chaperonin cofactor prefoldin